MPSVHITLCLELASSVSVCFCILKTKIITIQNHKLYNATLKLHTHTSIFEVAIHDYKKAIQVC